MLRELLRVRSYAQIAKVLGLTEAAIRNYAQEKRTPDPRARDAMRKKFGWAEAIWAAPAKHPGDPYAAAEPATARAQLPSTKPRA
jgi:predicted transcriptional regulator